MHHAKDCCDDTIGTRLWHPAYCAWYDQDRAGHRLRAAVWGWIADRIVRWA